MNPRFQRRSGSGERPTSSRPSRSPARWVSRSRARRPSRPSSASTTRLASTWTPIRRAAPPPPENLPRRRPDACRSHEKAPQRQRGSEGGGSRPSDGPRTVRNRLSRSSRPKPVPSEPRSAPIAAADGLRAIRNRGRSGGSGRRARGWSQARRAFPAGMKRSVQSRHFKPCGAMVGAMWVWATVRPPRCPRKRRRVAQAPGCVSFCRVCGLPSPDGLTGAARGHGGGVGSDPPPNLTFCGTARVVVAHGVAHAQHPPSGVAPC